MTRRGKTCYIKRALDGDDSGGKKKQKKFLTNGSKSVKIKKNRESGEETKRDEASRKGKQHCVPCKLNNVSKIERF